MKKSFKLFKNYIVDQAKIHNACFGEFNKANESKNFAELLVVISENANWCYSRQIINADILLKFVDPNTLFENGFYVNIVDGNVENKRIIAFNSSVAAWDNSSVVAWDNSSVVAWDNSSVVARGNSSVVAWDNSSVEARGNSSVAAWDNSSVVALGNSSVEARGNSSVAAWDNSSVVALGNSSVVARDNSSVEARGNSMSSVYRKSQIKSQHDNSIIKTRSGHEIYILKDKFRIVEI